MKSMTRAGAAALALLAAASAWAGGVREEQGRLQGTWRLVVLGPVSAPSTLDYEATATVTGDRLTFSGGRRYILRLAPTREPRELDMVEVTENVEDKGCVFKAIYKLEGDTLTLQYKMSGEARPNDFRESTGVQVMVLKYIRANKGQP
jgi:uncharacterized protein (TIGR03067 family)